MAKHDLTQPDYHCNHQYYQKEHGQYPSLTIIAAASPAVKSADDQDRCNNQVECQM